jgi:atypical dual specificity phosphatase
MSRPQFFSWIDEPRVAACAEPGGPEQLAWLRGQGVDILITLTEESLPRNWVDAAGLLSVHVPIADMDVPATEQVEQVMSVIDKARAANMGVAIHCLAGKGRTGTILAAYFVHRGMSARDAIQKVRDLRPGSIEVPEQEDAIRAFERSRRRS